MIAPCSWCKRPTSPHDRRYVDRYVTWWVCVDCYRATRRAPVAERRPFYTTAQKCKPQHASRMSGLQSEGV